MEILTWEKPQVGIENFITDDEEITLILQHTLSLT